MIKAALTLCVCILISFSALTAQDLMGRFNVSPFGGIGIPMGDLASDDPDEILDGDAAFRSIGFKFGVAAEFFFTPSIAAGVSFRYASFGSKEIELLGETFESDSKVTGMLFGAHAKFVLTPAGPVRPYILGGGGLFMSKYKDVEGILYDFTDIDKIDVDIDSKFYFMFGGGVMFFVSPNISLFGEATFDYALTDGATLEYEDMELGEIGTNYYFLDLIVGLNIWFGGI
ncbi:MAG: outer membrane beta-barrel protein [candidate division Zixibacteria bacterium]|nr:outer membrane beta-barrel protein [candidate division Zixibacteria bacterium]NIR63747.1 outer membrane beta-barrel protein [candidate division Zixibacteria bacterium]NIS14998.1 outer membrane beta-barrel protein [candidate division Zixibacteria bacterium]NIS45707.1 outer membrane beta-barrel protein [candidate division Zixibacteria bacterium]NIT51255.1 outer membrane beta-barrel protein [candidate division Zixibacteria bacterium]